MTPRSLLCAAAIGALCTPAAAHASVPHTVAPGETLWGLAMAQNMTTRSYAAANGLAPDAHVIAGATVDVPTVGEAAAALAARPVSAPAATTVPTAAPAAPVAPTPASGPAPLGGYTVRPGDTLSGLAAHAGVSAARMAYANGLSADAKLVAGTVLRLPTGAPAPVRAAEPAPAPVVVGPEPAPGRVTSSQIAAVAGRNGVPASLASAIGWQESGFNNGMVSSANARGVMQVLPGTFDWVQSNLARRPLNPASPEDNVGAGVLYLGQLLRETGGDPALAAAGYYQGLSSVRRIGMLPDTKRYVANVLALRGRFGG